MIAVPAAITGEEDIPKPFAILGWSKASPRTHFKFPDRSRQNTSLDENWAIKTCPSLASVEAATEVLL